MKKLKIFAISLLGIVVVGYLLLFIAARILFPPERLKEIITPKISEAVGREVSIEGVGLSVFPGLSLNAEGLTIANAEGFSDKPLLKVGDLYLNVKLLPLLRKRVEVASILIKNPKILIEKSITGKFNFEMAGEEKAKVPSEAEEPETSPFSLVVNSARIEDGTLIYLDHQENYAIAINKIHQNISISLDEELTDIRTEGQLDIKDINFRDMKKNEAAMNFPSAIIKHNFKIDTRSKNVQIEQLMFVIESTQLNFAGSLKNYDTTPNIDLSLRTNEIELSNILSIIPHDLAPMLTKLTAEGRINLKMDVKGEISENKTPNLNGNIVFNNLTLSYSELPSKISNLNGSIGFTDKSLNFRNITARLGNEPVELSGSIIDFEHPKYDLKFKADLNLSTLKDYIESPNIQSKIPPDKLPMLTKLHAEGKINLEIAVNGEISEEKTPNVNGSLSFNNLTLGYSELPGKITNLSGGIGFTDKKLDFRNITARLGNDPVELSGSIIDFEHPRYDLKLKTDLNLNAVKDYIELPKGTSLSGRLKANIIAKGSVDKPENTRLNGRISVSNSSFTTPNLAVPLTDINSEVNLAGRKVKISNLTLRAAKSSISLTGEILDPIHNPKGTLQLTSSLLDLDEIFPETESEEDVTSKREPIKLPFETLDGKVIISKLISNKIVMNNLRANMIIRNNVLSIKNMRSDLYSGKLTGSATADFNDPSGLAYTIQMKGDGLDVNDFATTAIPIEDAFFGKMQIEVNASGTGLSTEEIKKNIVAEGTTVVFDGKIVNLPVLHSLAKFLNLPSFEEISFKTLNNSFKLQNEKLSFENFEMKAFDNDLSLGGFIGLDGSLDISVSMLLSEELTQRFHERAVKVPNIFLVDSSRLPLDFTITGTKNNPKIRWDTEKAVSRAAEKTVQTGLEKGLEKIFGSLKTDSLESNKDKKEGDPLKNVLEGLFGKKKKKKKGKQENN